MMFIGEMIAGEDGKPSTAKMAALLAHISFWASFVKFQLLGDVVFNEALWVCYGGFAIAHAVVNKSIEATRDISATKSDERVQIANVTGQVPPEPGETQGGEVTTTTQTKVK